MFDKEQTLDLRVLGKNSSNENSWWQQHPDDERSHLNEECGLFGVWGHPDAARLTYFGLHALQHRGQEGAGILVNNNGKLNRHRGLGLVTEVFRDEKDDGALGLAHNGNLTNAQSLRCELEKSGAIFSSNSDTEILMHLIRRSHHPEFMGRVKEALNTVKGGFAYLIMTENSIVAALDPNGFRPLSIGKMSNGALVVASETCAFDVVGATWIQDVQPGEIIEINDDGIHVDQFTDSTNMTICSMEYIYFARPDSNIAGVNVHTARKRSGKILAQEAQIDADIVIGVPNSSLSAASGYAEESGLPYEMGLIKNQYVARTFIQPTQELREQGVRMKLSAVRGVVEGKRVIMVDDSIVRGTTSRRIVKLLKDAGAAEVHVAIASPALKYPCFYGIDIQDRDELIAATHTTDEIREAIGADSLTYLSQTGLVEAIGHDKLCLSYFDGEYPTPLYDYEADYLESLAKNSVK